MRRNGVRGLESTYDAWKTPRLSQCVRVLLGIPVSLETRSLSSARIGSDMVHSHLNGAGFARFCPYHTCSGHGPGASNRPGQRSGERQRWREPVPPSDRDEIRVRDHAVLPDLIHHGCRDPESFPASGLIRSRKVSPQSAAIPG